MAQETDPTSLLRSMMSEAGPSHRMSLMSTGLVAMDVEEDAVIVLNELIAVDEEAAVVEADGDGETGDDLQNFLAGKMSFKELASKMDADDDIASEEDDDEERGSDDGLKQQPRRLRGRRSKLDEVGASLLGNAELYFARGKCEDAIAMVLQVVKEHPMAHELYQTLGDFYEQLGEDDKALQYYHIAAYLCPNDGDSWRTVADKHAEQGDFKTAIKCYDKAIRLIPLGRDQVDCRMEKARILEEEIKDSNKAVEAYEGILNLCKEQDGDFATDLAKKVARLHFENKNGKAAIRVLETNFDKYESFIVSENVNMYIELLITEKLMVRALIAFSKYCGVKILHSQSGNAMSESAIDEQVVAEEASLIAIQLMFPMPIDLLSKLIVCLICLRATHSVPSLQSQIEEASVETTGDLYLDVAEAYIEARMFSSAERFLHKLVASVSYGNEAAVWLRYARCLKEMRQDDRSITAYFHVLSLEPNHFEARLELSRLLLAHDRSSEAVEVSSQVGSSLVNLDLLSVRCKLLFEKKRFSEFVTAALTLLQCDMIYLKHDKEITCMITSTTHRTRLESLRDIHKELKITPLNQRQSYVGKEPTADEFFSIYVKVCHVLANEERDYPELIRVVLSAYTSQLLSDRESSLDFIALMALYKAQDTQYSYILFKAIIARDPKNNQVWNVFCAIVCRMYQDLRHNRFCLRLFMKHPDLLPLAYFNGHNALMSGSYKHALAEYVNIHKQRPEDPFPVFCVSLAFVHLASQKYINSKNSVVVQLCAFLDMYIALRGECQESFFNVGRMFHQIGLLQNAVHFYKRALICPVPVASTSHEKSIFDLRSEIAYNLASVYKSSGSQELSLYYLRKYCVV